MTPTKLILFILAILIGCSDEQPSALLETDLFVAIYVEAVTQTSNPTEQDSLSPLNTALLKHNIDRSTFDQTVEYYNTNPELWSDIFTKIAAELEAKKVEE